LHVIRKAPCAAWYQKILKGNEKQKNAPNTTGQKILKQCLPGQVA